MISSHVKTSPFILRMILIAIMWLQGCVKDKNFEIPEMACEEEIKANATFEEIKSLYDNGTIQIQEDLIIEGYIGSSDEEGNFFGVLFFQNALENPTDGFRIEIDLRDSHLFYSAGDKVLISLKGLYVGKTKDVYKLGGVFNSFGNLSVGRIPSKTVFEHIFVSCDNDEKITPTITTITELKDEMVNTLVKIEDVEFSLDNLGQSFAEKEEETERALLDCNDNELLLVNSGYADFWSELLPEGRGSITGILVKDGGYKLIIRNLNDIQFKNERCEDFVDEFTSQAIFITELADPENNTGARFVELYNAAKEPLSLKGWTLVRYTNASLEISSTIDLTGTTIRAESTLVISPNEEEFKLVYGFTPDITVGTNSPADSNGDDNLQLIDPFGTVIDTFGVIGEKGSGTDHEFEDGRAMRKTEIIVANAIYDFSEWIIYNDTGSGSTINAPQVAPTDYTPGVR
ncbi:lamin tail domain-containing protein [Maribacter sp. MMG018]|uniref:DUF5689 domain-containing protein n=1 Tax=Maribacter sp. MMG018 TaxID=2822688 RepID=UPI001B399659|nr:DUF5689 domain-containing protein [Maribacter sp. MMG018]MBQ4913141.1 lamin tail domain-containing protein [Maribacter sp. MMG018]